jgi:hypothetical protein
MSSVMQTGLGALGLFAAALVAGAVNSLAGGASLISFPALAAPLHDRRRLGRVALVVREEVDRGSVAGYVQRLGGTSPE